LNVYHQSLGLTSFCLDFHSSFSRLDLAEFI
jgi:hypothetical protein